jgi:serine/threonine protein kinase/tetratricopeptide (TPR) repeat protein/TolB-like protein
MARELQLRHEYIEASTGAPMQICPVCSYSNPEDAIACRRCDSSLSAEETVVISSSSEAKSAAKAPDSASLRAGRGSGFETFALGEVIAGRYEVLSLLGQGGMGTVYKVFDRELERTVVLKAIRPELIGNASLLRRLKQETLLTRQIAHPNVVRVFDLGVAGRLRFITMEFVDGDDLRTVLDRVGKLSPKEAVAVVKQICSGLEAAHAEDVTHRDLKPRNILIGRDGRVRIADFGLARSLEETGLTRTGGVIGTPDYMAPEQATGDPTDGRSDIFALGVVFYECLTGRLPFTNRSFAGSLLSRTRNSAEPITAVDPSLPDWLARIVMRCLERDPGKRFQTARELLAALEAKSVDHSSASESASGVIQPGSMLGTRYRVEALAGEGGMGKVYRATDLELDRIVALKVVHPNLANDRKYLARLRREISLASQISHPNVLRIHDLGEANGLRFVSMAWADGEDLAQLLRRSRVLSERDSVRIAIEICEGLGAAHANGVVHRDLKPSNILLDSAGHACIADFGVAIGREGAGTSTFGGVRDVIGTPRYMSPEQAEGKAVSVQSDLYAVGLIMYEMVTGTVPFGDGSVHQMLALRVSDIPENPRKLNPALSGEAAAIIMRCLERDPANRYPSAHDLLTDLKPLQEQPKTSATARLRKKKLMLVAGAALCVIAALAIWATLHFRAARHPFPAETGGKHIAVLPFRVLSADANVKLEAEGIAASISARLFSLNDVHPVSGPALERVDLRQSNADVARQLGANLIVLGTVQAEGDRLQVFTRLEDVKTGQTVWSRTFGGLRQDLFALEDEISTGVIGALNIAPTIQERERQPVPDTQSLPAYDLYLQGRDAFKQRNVNGATEALKAFEQAVAKDHDFALAWTGVSDASLFLYRSTKNTSWAQKALLAAREAEQRNHNLPEVHFALGSVYSATGKNAQAIEEIRKALELAPNSDDGYIRLARAYLETGQSDSAIAAAKRAVDINPFYWYNHKQLGFVYQACGRIADALEQFKRQVDLNPHDATGYLNIGGMYYLEGKLNESIPYFRKAIEVRSTFDAYANLGTVYYQLGQYKDAIAMAQKAVDLNPNSSAALRNLAQIYASAGEQANANATYDRAIEAAYKVLQVNPRNADELGILAMCFGGKRDYQRARETLARARSINPSNRDLIYNEAVLDAQSGRMSAAIGNLQKALENGTSFAEASRDPALAPVRQLPQFAALEKRFGTNPAARKE